MAAYKSIQYADETARPSTKSTAVVAPKYVYSKYVINTSEVLVSTDTVGMFVIPAGYVVQSLRVQWTPLASVATTLTSILGVAGDADCLVSTMTHSTTGGSANLGVTGVPQPAVFTGDVLASLTFTVSSVTFTTNGTGMIEMWATLHKALV